MTPVAEFIILSFQKFLKIHEIKLEYCVAYFFSENYFFMNNYSVNRELRTSYMYLRD